MLDYFTPCWHDDELTWCFWKAWSRPKGKCCPESEEMGGTHKRDDSLMYQCYDCEKGAVWSACGKTSRRSRRPGRERRSFLSWFLRDRKVHGGRVAIDSIIHTQIHQLMEGVSIQNKLSLHPKSPAASDGVRLNIWVWEVALDLAWRETGSACQIFEKGFSDYLYLQ